MARPAPARPYPAFSQAPMTVFSMSLTVPHRWVTVDKWLMEPSVQVASQHVKRRDPGEAQDPGSSNPSVRAVGAWTISSGRAHTRSRQFHQQPWWPPLLCTHNAPGPCYMRVSPPGSTGKHVNSIEMRIQRHREFKNPAQVDSVRPSFEPQQPAGARRSKDSM